MGYRDGGSAFPVLEHHVYADGGYLDLTEPGMTLRDYFAGQALAGLAARIEFQDSNADAAIKAYCLADAMLAEGEKNYQEDKNEQHEKQAD